jgi:predicted cupin superfamily sugar epimerase
LQGLKRHSEAGFFNSTPISLANAKIVEQALNKDGLDDVRSAHHQLYALLQTQIDALRALHQLQENWIHYVERDADTEEVLRSLTHKQQTFELFARNHKEHESESSGVLSSQIDELSQETGKARKTFMNYQEANTRRSSIFASFQANSDVEFS